MWTKASQGCKTNSTIFTGRSRGIFKSSINSFKEYTPLFIFYSKNRVLPLEPNEKLRGWATITEKL